MFSTSSKLVFTLALAISAAAAPLSANVAGVEVDERAVKNFARTSAFQRLVVFGDSFSDDGHGAWVISNHTWPADPAYYRHSFSNGPVWPIVLSQTLGSQLTDKATGGATSNNTAVQGYTGANSTIPVPSALDQIAQYISQTPASYGDSGSLYAIIVGANDVFFDPSASADAAVQAITKGIKQLRTSEGASTFIIASYPDLSLLPFAIKLGSPAYSTILSNYSTALANGLSALAKNPPTGTRIAYIDLYNIFPQILANPTKYGFSPQVVGQNCLNGAYPSEGVPRSVCSDPDKRVFWDIYHPSAKTHKIIADEAVKALAKVC
ncbi:hypothetical protein FRB90_002635 [Tulasnella sp. 427]|nr:hypothetical protein FRB90_002635 [Tulasnella sp. 427]